MADLARRADWIAAAGRAMLALLLGTAWLVAWYIVWLLPLAGLGGDRHLRVARLLLSGYRIATRVTYQVVFAWAMFVTLSRAMTARAFHDRS